MTQTKLRIENGIPVVSERVWVGGPVRSNGYTPVAHQKPVEEIVKYYQPWPKYRFNPMISTKDWAISERRRVAIQAVVNARIAVRTQAQKLTKYDHEVLADKLLAAILQAKGVRKYVNEPLNS